MLHNNLAETNKFKFKRLGKMNKAYQKGITLIEVLVTMFVMTVGLLGLAGLQATSVKDGLDNAKRSQVTWLVTEIIERVRANPDGYLAAAYDTTIASADCPSAPVQQCSDNSQGAAAIDCTPDQMAAFDVWEVFCGQAEAGIMANATDSLNLTSVTTACVGACSATSNFTVTINWESLAVSNSTLLSDTAIAAQKSQSITMTVRP
ncbi:MAG: type IV pilus assembly protein PilV [Oceanicoccus sp.]